jgi:hypothetical protein
VSALVKQMLTREVGKRTPSMLDVAKVLRRFTAVTAPDFVAPSGVAGPPVTPKTMESARNSARPKARVVQSQDADPRGPTMLSSPPVNSSLQLAPAPTQPRRSWFGLAMIAVLLVAVALLAMDRKPAAQSSSSTAELPTLPGPPEKAAIVPVATALGEAPGATGAPSAAPPSVPVASAKPRDNKVPAPSHPGTSPKPTPAATTPTPGQSPGGASLFPGRK